MTARGVRNNNPGNIDFKPGQFLRDKWVGEIGIEDHPDARFTTFKKPLYGIRAVGKILLTYQRRYELLTIRQMINRWAPPIENDTDAYEDFVTSRVRMDPDTPIDLPTCPQAFRELTAAIIRMETGEDPYNEDLISDALTMALA